MKSNRSESDMETPSSLTQTEKFQFYEEIYKKKILRKETQKKLVALNQNIINIKEKLALNESERHKYLEQEKKQKNAEQIKILELENTQKTIIELQSKQSKEINEMTTKITMHETHVSTVTNIIQKKEANIELIEKEIALLDMDIKKLNSELFILDKRIIDNCKYTQTLLTQLKNSMPFSTNEELTLESNVLSKKSQQVHDKLKIERINKKEEINNKNASIVKLNTQIIEETAYWKKYTDIKYFILKKIKIRNEKIETIREKYHDQILELEKYAVTIHRALDERSIQLNKIEEIIKVEKILNEQLISLAVDAQILSDSEIKINQELQNQVHFASSQYLDEERISDILFDNLDKNITSKDICVKIHENIINQCDWKKISRVYNVNDMVFILMSFYNQYIKNHLHINASKYSRLFTQFLIENAIPIENAILKEEIAKTQTLNSLARLIWFYSKYVQVELDIGNFIAATIHHSKLKIAINEAQTNSDEKRKLVLNAIKWLIDIIKNCPHRALADQIKFVSYFILTDLSLSVKKKCPKKLTDRLHADLLNILQFHYVHNLSLGKKLEAVTGDDIYIGNGIYLPSIRKTHFLHADLFLLQMFAIDHMLNCEKHSTNLTLFPEKKPIILGMNKLNNVHSYMFIKTLNEKSNSKIVATGTQNVSNYKHTSMSFMCRTFFERMQTEIEQKKSASSLDDSGKKRLTTFLIKESKLMSKQMKNYNKYSLIHSSFFNPKDHPNNTSLAHRHHTQDASDSPRHDHAIPKNPTQAYSSSAKRFKQ